MELRHIRHFLAVVEQGSLGRAAKSLDISEPALSKSIKRLESSLGVTLFDRTPVGVVPTDHGASFAERARVIANEIQHLRDDLDAVSGLSRGLVRIGASPSFATAILPAALSRLHQTHPDIRVVVTQGFLPLVGELLQGQIDLAFVSLQDQPHDPLLIEEPLLDYGVHVVARAGHTLAFDRPPSRQQLLDTPWALAQHPDPFRVRFDTEARRANLFPLDIVLETNSIRLITAYVTESNALSYLPEHVIGDELRSGRLVTLDIPDLHWRRRMGVVRRKRTSLSLASRALIDAVKAVCAQEGRSHP